LSKAAATADKLQSTADDVKTVRKAPAREVGLYRTSPYNINDAGNDEYYGQSSLVGVSEMSFAITRCTCLCIRQLPAFTYGEYGFFANFINQLTVSANNQHRMLPCTPNAMACYWR
jgi:hypothetical protein